MASTGSFPKRAPWHGGMVMLQAYVWPFSALVLHQ
jgi:hypothetical protein